MDKKRYSHIDLLEAIAIFFVILYHVGIYSVDFLKDPSALIYIRFFFRPILATCVPLFFFSNGYLLLKKDFSLKKHLMKLLRIVVLTLFWGFVGAALSALAARETVSVKNIWGEFIDMSHKWDLHIFWFMGALAELYILFPALKALYDMHKKAFLFLTLACLFFVSVLPMINRAQMLVCIFLDRSPVDIEVPLLEIFNPFQGTYDYALFYFCAGGLLHHVESRILAVPVVKRNIISIVGILVSCSYLFCEGIAYSRIYQDVIDMVWSNYASFPTFVCVVCLYILSLNYTVDNRFIRFISSNTMGIYFTHFIFIHITRPQLPNGGFYNSVCFAILYTFLIEGLCLVVCYVLRKLRFTRVLVSLS